MKLRIALLLAAVTMVATPANVSLANETLDAIVVEDDIITAEDDTEVETFTMEETESTVSAEIDDGSVEETFIMSVEVADEPAAVATTASGTCGDDLTWTLDSSGVLTITGTGAMTEGWSSSNVPWSKYTGSIKSVSIGDKVTTIGDWAFANCENLTSVVIPDSVTEIGEQAFHYCTSLENVTIGSGVTLIDKRAFLGCESLTNLVIPDNVITIDYWAFHSCSGLTNVSIGSGVETVGSQAFAECSSLKSVTIPPTVNTIGAEAFGCYFLSYADATSTVAVENSDEAMAIEGGWYVAYEDFLIYGYTGTAAETYANKYNITFISIGVIQKDISSATATLDSDLYYYDGEAQTPEVTVILESEDEYDGYRSVVTLVEGTDYTVTYSNNMNVGTATVTVTGIGNYKGTLTLNFTIESFGGTMSTGLDVCFISNLTNTAKGIKIEWNQVSGASGYYIYRQAVSGDLKLIKTIKSGSTVSYTDKKVVSKNGTVYSYTVLPYSENADGGGAEATIVRLTGTTLTSIKNSAAGKAKVKWTAVTDVTGYQIQYSTAKSFSSYKIKTVVGETKKAKTLSGLTKGKTYYVRIRTYKIVDGVYYYSAWSSKLKVKITK
ncbi:MAG: fibronectin type III domain-containing protein [Lachnospiraceae bacterium]|nr:fibronectin type III domain-containing protein [Lachnospiraceae bacterium]